MQLTPEQRQAAVTSITKEMLDLIDCETIVVYGSVDSIAEDIADAAIGAILSLSSPPSAEVVTGASSGVPSPDSFAETCKWEADSTCDSWVWKTDCGEKYHIVIDYIANGKYRFCPRCGKPLEVVK